MNTIIEEIEDENFDSDNIEEPISRVRAIIENFLDRFPNFEMLLQTGMEAYLESEIVTHDSKNSRIEFYSFTCELPKIINQLASL